MPTITQRGKAVLEGIAGTFDVITYPIAQTGKLTQNWEEELVKDEHGFDAAWLERNVHYLADFSFKIVGDTAAHAQGAAVFLAALATVTLSGFQAAAFNGSYQNISGADIDLSNVKVADLALKLRRYDDTTQNTLSQTTPS